MIMYRCIDISLGNQREKKLNAVLANSQLAFVAWCGVYVVDENA